MEADGAVPIWAMEVTGTFLSLKRSTMLACFAGSMYVNMKAAGFSKVALH